jgi:N,N'-diacetyllegionaminate synthase
LSTAFDFKSLEFLSSLNLDFWKIPSGEITNYPYLKKIAQTHLPVVMSTGMCTNEDIERALNVIVNNGVSIKDIILLHCNTQYPTPYSDVNLRAMAEMSERFGVKVGYSDHTEGIDVPIAAVALGASVIEKHFTLDRTLPGPDHRASLEPHELKRMVEAIRNVETALGRANKQVTSSESVNIIAARKSIVASTKIKKGELLTEDNLTVKRPGNGLSPMLWDEVIGKTAYRDFNVDELIELKNQDV